MGKLPRYQRMGVRARQVQGTDYAGFRGQAGTAQTVSAAFDQMGSFLNKQAQQEARDAGLERVRSEGAQPLLEQLQEQGGPRGIEERTAYEAANRIAVAEIRTEAEFEISRILSEGQEKKQSYSAIQAQLKDVTDGFPAALSDIDPVNAGLLRTQLQDVSGKAELRYSKWWTGEVAKQTRARQNKAAANKGEAIVGNATVAGYTMDQINEDIAKEAQSLADLGVSEDKVNTWAEGVKEKAYRENFLFNFYQKPIAEQGEQMEAILEGKETMPGLDYEESIRFVNGLLRPEYNRNVAVMKSQSDFVVNKVDDLEDVLLSGGVLDPEVFASLNDKANDVGEFDGGASLAALNKLQDTETFFRQMRGASLGEVEGIVNSLQDGSDGTLDTALEIERLEQAQTFLDNMRTSIKEDPLGYAATSGLIERKPLIITDENGVPAIDRDALEERTIAAQMVQDRYGLAQPRMLFANEARELNIALERSEGFGKLQILGTVAEFNQASGQVLTELAGYNPDMAMVGSLVNVGATETASVAIAGLERIKAGEKPVEFTPTNTIPVESATFGRAMTTPKQRKAVLGVAKAIYTEMAASQGLDTFDDDLYGQALQMAAGQRDIGGVTYGGIQEVRDVATFINPRRTAEDYENVLNNLTPELVSTVLGQQIDPGLAEQIRGKSKTFRTKKSTSEYNFVHIGGDKYKIEPNADGTTFVSDIDGDPIIVHLEKMILAVKYMGDDNQ